MEISRRLSDGKIIQYGANLGEVDGCENLELSDALAEQFLGMLPQQPTIPFGGIAYNAGVLSVMPPPPPLPAPSPAPDIAGLISALTASPSIDQTTKNRLTAALQGQ